jgi:hypothetical protein
VQFDYRTAAKRSACDGLTRHFAASGELWLSGLSVGAIEALSCRYLCAVWRHMGVLVSPPKGFSLDFAVASAISACDFD